MPYDPRVSMIQPEGAAPRAAGAEAELAGIRALAERQRTRTPAPAPLDLSVLQPLADGLAARLDPAARDDLARRAAALGPWLQGPFPLGGDLVVGGAWRSDLRWHSLGEVVPASLAGLRVLDVGSNAGYDAFMFRRRGAAEVVACEPGESLAQAEFLESLYRTGIVLKRISWQQLDPAEQGTFDLVHCNGLLHQQASPVALLQALRRMVRDDGTLILGTMTLAEPELSQYVRFVADAFDGDDSCWTVPGRLAARWMLEVCGFQPEREFGETPLDSGEFPVINLYVECGIKEPSPTLSGVLP